MQYSGSKYILLYYLMCIFIAEKKKFNVVETVKSYYCRKLMFNIL